MLPVQRAASAAQRRFPTFSTRMRRSVVVAPVRRQGEHRAAAQRAGVVDRTGALQVRLRRSRPPVAVSLWFSVPTTNRAGGLSYFDGVVPRKVALYHGDPTNFATQEHNQRA